MNEQRWPQWATAWVAAGVEGVVGLGLWELGMPLWSLFVLAVISGAMWAAIVRIVRRPKTAKRRRR